MLHGRDGVCGVCVCVCVCVCGVCGCGVVLFGGERGRGALAAC